MLTRAVDDYLAVRRAAGFALSVDAGLLRDFARFAGGRAQTHVRQQTAIEWATQAPSPAQRERRLGMVRRLAVYLRAEDSVHERVPPNVFAHRRTRPFPYLLSDRELQQLLAATARLRPRGSLRPLTYCTLFGLLAATGLRISEALHLALDDIDADGLVIRQTKFRKSRLVLLPNYAPPTSTPHRGCANGLADRARFAYAPTMELGRDRSSEGWTEFSACDRCRP